MGNAYPSHQYQAGAAAHHRDVNYYPICAGCGEENISAGTAHIGANVTGTTMAKDLPMRRPGELALDEPPLSDKGQACRPRD